MIVSFVMFTIYKGYLIFHPQFTQQCDENFRFLITLHPPTPTATSVFLLGSCFNELLSNSVANKYNALSH